MFFSGSVRLGYKYLAFPFRTFIPFHHLPMFFHLPTAALLLSLALLADASSHRHSRHVTHAHRKRTTPATSRDMLLRRTCKSDASSNGTCTTALATLASPSPSPPTSGGGAVAAGGFKATKPTDWPSATQAGPTPTSTVASDADKYLEELSKAIDNSGNAAFTAVHTGEMTYYAQGLGACGDVYDDNSFTAAVSHIMFDAWPGASAEQNRNPICGPYVPGRTELNSAGAFEPVSSVKSSGPGYAQIGGDGVLNCVGTAAVPCHVPLTATVTHAGKSIQVKIVDRCTGCQENDIDLTPAAFKALADKGLGRTSVTWNFDSW
ncbi:hypothetical protein B0H15DRAFT_1024929 [Mycena belliarum]|uniref:RlpA-like protein double-psi beta-barrel domain-containing protein n=1 Tax=Mycena belliarum TaxID=1033014 RepID=A0AAD6TVU5_9AGAR|nr:hypothetical protein B0H15DRAFT_1024929 [Mycena belliae]